MRKQKPNNIHAKSNSKQSLRIISGQWRGRLLAFADVPGLRPTGNRIRETLFNWLAPYLHNSQVLDLYAGSGALSFEALSRGAKAATIVELDPKAYATLIENCQSMGISTSSVKHSDALRYLEQVPTTAFDIAFVDPPFDESLWQSTFNALDNQAWLTEQALIYVEAPKHHVLTPPTTWSLLKEKSGGAVTFRLYQKFT